MLGGKTGLGNIRHERLRDNRKHATEWIPLSVGLYSDLSVVKKFQIFERLSAQFRMDAFNIFNHPVYAFSQNNGANGCIDCQGGNNGKITALESGTTMRQLQFAIRFDF